ncbi:TPA: hypothetical protein N0F65_002533 [Lagenidium giganteum]|uniref:Uncharacterized protein n=1 Tax=Lagenidium giganteum TaxID=4803 RepID=A0AAV2YPR8_9STRA|nr:TPA: hypothetical protein N0F65_002533 [Lagenidium giganteum]
MNTTAPGPPVTTPKCSVVPCFDVDKFVRFTASSVRADKVSKTIGYGLGSLGHVLAITQRKDSDVSTGLKKLSSNISMARYVVRFTGALESYEALKNGSWCYGDDDDHLRMIVKLQAYSMLVYYPLENLSYVGYIAPKLLNIDADKISRQSCLAWTLYVGLDIYANQLRIKALNEKEKQLLAQTDLSATEKQALLTTLRKRRSELYYIQLRNACYFPTCLHWSLKNGLIPDWSVQFLCFTEALVGVWRAWVNLA